MNRREGREGREREGGGERPGERVSSEAGYPASILYNVNLYILFAIFWFMLFFSDFYFSH